MNFNEEVTQIKKVLVEGAKRLANKDKSIGLAFNDCDQIIDNVYLGNSDIATNRSALRALNVTHVLNCAQGKQTTQINTNQEYYNDCNIQFLGLNLMDDDEVTIHHFFQIAADYMHQAIKDNNGKVLVHCYQGISRSASFVIAYLMIYKNMKIVDAIKLVSSKRYIFPNDGFLRQLILLDKELQKTKN